MHYRYENAMRVTIPAVRAAVALTLSKEHGMSETMIAKRLGVAQAAVSKYLSGKYSPKMRGIVKLIIKNGLHKRMIVAVCSGQDRDKITRLTDQIASDNLLVGMVVGRLKGGPAGSHI